MGKPITVGRHLFKITLLCISVHHARGTDERPVLLVGSQTIAKASLPRERIVEPNVFSEERRASFFRRKIPGMYAIIFASAFAAEDPLATDGDEKNTEVCQATRHIGFYDGGRLTPPNQNVPLWDVPLSRTARNTLQDDADNHST